MLDDMDKQWLLIFHKIVNRINFGLLVENNAKMHQVNKEGGIEALNDLAIKMTYGFVMDKFTDGRVDGDDGSILYTDEELEDYFYKTLEEV